ncbi:MAG: DUF1573 domain-containing protein [Planctomycetaceae bacterium]|nr:DUF1573 domain-containing protein [Planctomycetaceae bacterium]
MNPKTLMMTVAVVVVGLVIVSMVSAPSREDKILTPPQEQDTLPPPPEIKTEGKQPKVVTEQTEFDFGKQAQYETGRHTFKIYNQGEAPLELSQGESSCKCTLGNLDKTTVEPGDFTEVELEWTPEGIAEAGSNKKFRQYAVVYTNDPERPEIQFNVTGVVFAYFQIVPDRSWPVGELTIKESRSVKGRITSMSEPFKIKSIDATSKFITADFVELTEEQKKEYDVDNGYEITVTVNPGYPYGDFEDFLILHTDYKEESELRIHVKGAIKGPFTFLNTTRQSGVRFSTNAWILDMGSFSADEGRIVEMRVFVAEMPEGENFNVLSAETDLEFLEVSVTGDDQPAQNGRAEVRMKFEYKAGSPSIIRGGSQPVTVTFKTNHPEAEEFKIRVLFAAN